jgi:hypothetical protein
MRTRHMLRYTYIVSLVLWSIGVPTEGVHSTCNKHSGGFVVVNFTEHNSQTKHETHNSEGRQEHQPTVQWC